VNVDDDRLGITPSEFAKVEEAIIRLNGDPDVIVLDEIQNVPGWEMFVSRLVTNKRIIITGSNATPFKQRNGLVNDWKTCRSRTRTFQL